jgi:hypothetical protein
MRPAHILGLSGLVLATVVHAQQFSVVDIEKELVAGSSQLNRTLPMWINRDVRLDTSFPGHGLKLTYVLTITNTANGMPATINELSPERVKVGICNDPQRRVLLLNGVAFHYMYRREDLKPLANIRVSAADCGLSAYR